MLPDSLVPQAITRATVAVASSPLITSPVTSIESMLPATCWNDSCIVLWLRPRAAGALRSLMREVARYFVFALSKLDRLTSPKNPLTTSSIQTRVVHEIDDNRRSAAIPETECLVLMLASYAGRVPRLGSILYFGDAPEDQDRYREARSWIRGLPAWAARRRVHRGRGRYIR